VWRRGWGFILRFGDLEGGMVGVLERGEDG
jgi:hypothetical protein